MLSAIVAFIRVGEKLLQGFGPRRPMIWGSRSECRFFVYEPSSFPSGNAVPEEDAEVQHGLDAVIRLIRRVCAALTR
jgi:hypothetical protein